MDGAASIITFISLALSSTHCILKALSGIKNAPHTVQQVSASVLTLLKLLEQLKAYSDSLHYAADLPDSIKRCAEDLSWLKEYVEKASSEKSNKVGQLKKNCMVMLQGREWDRRSALVQQHYTALSLQIGIIEGKRGSEHTHSLERVEELSNKQVALSTSNSDTLERAIAAVGQMRDSVQGIGAASQASDQRSSQALRMLGDKMEDIASLSTEQSNTLEAIFELLKQQFSAKSQEASGETVAAEAVETSEDVDMDTNARANSSGYDDLQESLSRLRHLAQEKQNTVFSAEAEAIIQDFERIFFPPLNAERDERSNKDDKGKRRRDSTESDSNGDELEYQHEIKRIKGLLTASHCVAVNDKASRSWTVAPGLYNTENKHYSRRSHSGTLTVQTRRRYRNSAIIQKKSAENSQNETLGSLEATIAFMSNKSNAARIAVTFQQNMSYTGSFLRKPILSVSVLLPEDAEPFQLIKAGDLEGLKKSLSLKTSRLTDRDVGGRCLLNYAIRFMKPEICKFLIDEGADVNFCETRIAGDDELIPWHRMRSTFDYREDPHCLALTNQCRRVFLQAGADLTLYGPTLYGRTLYGYMYTALGVGTTETLQILLDHGSEFINTNSERPFASFLPDLLCYQKWTVESIRLLIRRGADPRDCLPLAITGSYMESPEGLRDALILLIINGADVYAKDVSGRSATEIACNIKTQWVYGIRKEAHNITSQTGLNVDLTLRDIWTEALAACGYVPEEVIYRSLQVAEVSDSDGDMDEDEVDYDISEGEDEDNASDADVEEDGDDYDISEDEDEDNDSTHQDGQGPELSLDNPKNSVIRETCSLGKESADDESREQTGSDAHGHFDWSIWEEDTNAWRT
ncbi:hypothetical protein JMJ35_007958 [Cladonia borealis]|uniref:Fungal N-terminal domain-containing protein n=1 Tax=Cladonia borealis TaxID=184061 RepID=A0AA39V378_9LECA|nr:hypothetical protein JMJ35_007958 [Cladonia borealis]